jgi:uncharacterized protein
MFIPRNIEKAIKDFTAKFPILSITGPRQSGKTTMLRNLFPEYKYVNLESPDLRRLAETDPKGFLENYDKFVIFDEIQRVPQLFSYLQVKVDEDRIMGQFIISGSQNFLLIENITQSLAGRVAIFKLLPFDLMELSQQNMLNENLDHTIVRGFYPSLFDRPILPEEYYPNYLETYIERDVRTLINVRDLSIFRKFLGLCAGRVGQLLNFNNIATECGINLKTAQAWLSILESSYIIFTLQPYYSNINKRLTKATKLFFYDTGLLCYLLQINKENLQNHYARGSIFENLIIAEAQKLNYHQDLHRNFYFYRDSNQNEIDLMVSDADKFDLIEIKSGKTINTEFFKGIQNFIKHSEAITKQKYLIYGGNEDLKYFDTQVLGWKSCQKFLERYFKEW